jgi:hypothetical protein
MASTHSKKEILEDFLPNMAAWDADHDFSSSRAKGEGESIFFKTLWKTFKDIGVPSAKPLGELRSELEALDIIFPFLERATGTTDAEKFQSIFLKEGEIGRFKRFQEDKEEYLIKSTLIATKEHGDKPKDTHWNLGSKELYDWLNPHMQTCIAFSIDTTIVPFDDCLLKDDGSIQARAFLINTREGVNDAASKTSVPKVKTEKIVDLKELLDNDKSHILYPAMDLNRVNDLTEQEDFCSKYSITISPIRNEKGKEAITVHFSNSQAERDLHILKGIKEQSHPNAVPILANSIRKLIPFLKPGNKNVDKKISYHTLLQGKRSGDWLQVLACLNPERYRATLPVNTRIFFVTIDKLALVYGLMMGIDVLFTYKNGEDRWLVMFHKDMGRIHRSPKQIVLDKIRLCPNPSTLSESYTQLKKEYMQRRSQIEISLYKTASSFLKNPKIEQGRRFQGDPIEQIVKQALEVATNLAVFRNTAIQIQEGMEEERIFDEDYQNSSSAEDMRELKKIYLQHYRILKDATQENQSLEVYFSNILKKNKDGSKNYLDQIKLIDKLQIFTKLLRSSNGGTNGIGIFTYLQALLKQDERQSLITFLLTVMNQIPDGEYKKQYTTFYKTAAILSGIPNSRGPSNLNLRNSDILSSIDALHRPQRVSGGGSEDDVDTIENSFQVTDFYAASILLAERAQYAFHVAPIGGAADKRAPKRGIDIAAQKEKRFQRAIDLRKTMATMKKPTALTIDHSPLTTFYLLLREIGFRLTQEHEENDVLQMLVVLIQNMLNFPETKEQVTIYKSFEYYLLEVLPNYTPAVAELMRSIKRDYYGFSDDISFSYASPLDSLVLQSVTANLQTTDSPDALIETCLRMMSRIIEVLQAIEVDEFAALPEIMRTGMFIPESEDVSQRTLIATGGNPTRNMKRIKRRIKGSPRRRTIRKTRRHR